MASTSSYHDDRRLTLARLVADHARLRRLIARKIPHEFQSLLDPDDVLQETALELLAPETRKPAAHIENLSRWLAGLALHCLHDSWVKLAPGVRAASGARTPDADGEPPDEPRAFGSLEWPGTNPAAACALCESASGVQAMLGCLTVEQRCVVELVCFEGRTAREAGRLMNKSPEAVKKLWQRIRAKLLARFPDAADLLDGF